MIRLLAAILLLMISCQSGAKSQKPASIDPHFGFTKGSFRCDDFLKAAIHLQSLGKDEALKLLDEEAKQNSTSYDVPILCRMLFCARPKQDFHRPSLGGSQIIAGEYEDWPLEPITIVDGVPFFIIYSYHLAGMPVSAEGYLSYCKHNCDWSTIRWQPKTPVQKRAALDKLLASPLFMNHRCEMEKRYPGADYPNPSFRNRGVNFLEAQIR